MRPWKGKELVVIATALFLIVLVGLPTSSSSSKAYSAGSTRAPPVPITILATSQCLNNSPNCGIVSCPITAIIYDHEPTAENFAAEMQRGSTLGTGGFAGMVSNLMSGVVGFPVYLPFGGVGFGAKWVSNPYRSIQNGAKLPKYVLEITVAGIVRGSSALCGAGFAILPSSASWTFYCQTISYTNAKGNIVTQTAFLPDEPSVFVNIANSGYNIRGFWVAPVACAAT